MHDDEVTDVPRQIDPTKFQLDDLAINRALVARQASRVTEVIEQSADYRIVRTGDGNHGWIFLDNIANQTADYVVQYAARRWNWLPLTVTQCLLWRNPGSRFVRHLTARMFFDYLLIRFPAVLSDRLQTENGHDFWIMRLVDAIGLNHRVGIVNMSQHQVTWFDPATDGDFDLWRRQQDTFGRAERYQAIRYLITKP